MKCISNYLIIYPFKLYNLNTFNPNFNNNNEKNIILFIIKKT